jgi:hypothetical protein
MIYANQCSERQSSLNKLMFWGRCEVALESWRSDHCTVFLFLNFDCYRKYLTSSEFSESIHHHHTKVRCKTVNSRAAFLWNLVLAVMTIYCQTWMRSFSLEKVLTWTANAHCMVRWISIVNGGSKARCCAGLFKMCTLPRCTAVCWAGPGSSSP